MFEKIEQTKNYFFKLFFSNNRTNWTEIHLIFCGSNFFFSKVLDQNLFKKIYFRKFKLKITLHKTQRPGLFFSNSQRPKTDGRKRVDRARTQTVHVDKAKRVTDTRAANVRILVVLDPSCGFPVFKMCSKFKLITNKT